MDHLQKKNKYFLHKHCKRWVIKSSLHHLHTHFVQLLTITVHLVSHNSTCTSKQFTFYRLENSNINSYITTESAVHHIAEDELVSGNLLFADGDALKTTDGTKTSLIARFSSIHSFAQLSRSEVIFTDFNNHCLRSLDRKTNQTSTYSGNCTNIGHRDGVDALLAHLVSVILDLMNSQQLISTIWGHWEKLIL